MSKLVDYDNEVFTSWAFYSVILLCKMMLNGIWTTKKRFDKQVNHLNSNTILCFTGLNVFLLVINIQNIYQSRIFRMSEFFANVINIQKKYQSPILIMSGFLAIVTNIHRMFKFFKHLNLFQKIALSGESFGYLSLLQKIQIFKDSIFFIHESIDSFGYPVKGTHTL